MSWIYQEANHYRVENYTSYRPGVKFIVCCFGGETSRWAAYHKYEGRGAVAIDASLKATPAAWHYPFNSADEAKEVCERYYDLMMLQ